MTKIFTVTKIFLSLALLLFLDAVILYFIVDLTYYTRVYLNFYIPVEFDVSIEKYKNFLLMYLVVIGLLLYEGIYFRRYDFWEEFKNILKALFFSFVIIFTFLSLSKTSIEYSRLFFIIFFIYMAMLLPLSKFFIKRFLSELKIWNKNICIIGNKEQANIIKNEITRNKYLGYTITPKSKAQTILIATKGMTTTNLKTLLHNELNTKKEVILVPYLDNYNIANTNMFEMFNTKMSFLCIENKLLVRHNRIIKLFSEYFLSLLVFPIFVILFFIIAIFIKLDSRGQILFKQKRLGKDGTVFWCIKFRTMFENQEKLLEEYLKSNPEEIANYEIYHKYSNDPRVTKVGAILRKFSLDELPQFFNVLKGDMSLIGPRPYMINETEKLGIHKELILNVKPGITGLWQVSGRNNLTFEERIQNDVWYIQNWSLWMDFIIFIKTFKVLLFKTGK